MLKTYTLTEMIGEWRTRCGFEPLRADCIAQCSGTDVDAHLTRLIGDWYINLLLTAPAALLNVEETAPICTLSEGRVTAGPGVVRVTSVKLSGWVNEAEPLTRDSPAAQRALALRANPYSAAGVNTPAAVLSPSGDSIEVWPCDESSRLLSAKGIVYNTDSELFTLSPTLLADIPRYFKSLAEL
ncbi:MAG: hypothetical protein K2M05_02095 [Paramuribaculum sp.]|nr:hypothetical protein [Paramuribaculum sp.]MDE6303991.1 hypothetical protein [Paramuribaculum sp.]